MPEPPRSLDDVRLPLYADILQGICLAVPTGQKSWLQQCSPHKPAQRWGQPCRPRSLLAKVPVVKEELLSCLDGSLGEDANAVVSVHHHNCNQRCNIRDVQPQLGLELSQHHVLPGLAGQGDPTFRIAVGVH